MENSVAEFRGAVLRRLPCSSEYSLEALEHEQQELAQRAARFAGCRDALEVWRKLGYADAEQIPSLTADELRGFF